MSWLLIGLGIVAVVGAILAGMWWAAASHDQGAHVLPFRAVLRRKPDMPADPNGRHGRKP